MIRLLAIAAICLPIAAHAQQTYRSDGGWHDSDVGAAPGDTVYRYGGSARNLTTEAEDERFYRSQREEQSRPVEPAVGYQPTKPIWQSDNEGKR